jgi:hypothetical protein
MMLRPHLTRSGSISSPTLKELPPEGARKRRKRAKKKKEGRRLRRPSSNRFFSTQELGEYSTGCSEHSRVEISWRGWHHSLTLLKEGQDAHDEV